MVVFLANVQAIRNNIVAKKTTELVLLFHKNLTKLVFLPPNMSQKNFKVLIKYFFIILSIQPLALLLYIVFLNKFIIYKN